MYMLTICISMCKDLQSTCIHIDYLFDDTLPGEVDQRLHLPQQKYECIFIYMHILIILISMFTD